MCVLLDCLYNSEGNKQCLTGDNCNLVVYCIDIGQKFGIIITLFKFYIQTMVLLNCIDMLIHLGVCAVINNFFLLNDCMH